MSSASFELDVVEKANVSIIDGHRVISGSMTVVFPGVVEGKASALSSGVSSAYNEVVNKAGPPPKSIQRVD